MKAVIEYFKLHGTYHINIAWGINDSQLRHED